MDAHHAGAACSGRGNVNIDRSFDIGGSRTITSDRSGACQMHMNLRWWHGINSRDKNFRVLEAIQKLVATNDRTLSMMV